MKIPQVLHKLDQLRVDAARQEVSAGRHIHPRNSVLDLVVIAASNEEAEHAAAITAELARHHPCRALIVQNEPGGSQTRLDALVSSRSHALMNGAVCQYEEVFLRVRGPAADHIPSLVDPLLAPDVDTYLWWTGSPPLTSERFHESLEVASTVILDSGAFERPTAMFKDLAAAAARHHPRPVFADFQWARLHGWREVLAQFFNPRDRRVFLTGIERVEITYGEAETDNRIAPTLLAGWLSTMLGWHIERPESETGRARLRTAAGANVDLQFEAHRTSGVEPGAVSGVVIEARGKGGECVVSARHDHQRGGHLEVGGQLWGRRLPSRIVPQEAPSTAALLSHLLMDARGDAVYPRVVRIAAQLLGAGR